MKFIDVGQQAEGIIAIGQIATGVVAIGQLATGVIAIGQGARGVFALGMVAIGVFAVGMGSAGVVYSVGMIGIGGRGKGFVIPLVPSFGQSYELPEAHSADEIAAGRPAEGWVRVKLQRQGDAVELVPLGSARTILLDARLRAKATRAAAEGARPVLVHVKRVGERLVAERVMDIPDPSRTRTRRVVVGALQIVVLVALCVAFWLVVGEPLQDLLFGPGGLLG